MANVNSPISYVFQFTQAIGTSAPIDNDLGNINGLFVHQIRFNYHGHESTFRGTGSNKKKAKNDAYTRLWQALVNQPGCAFRRGYPFPIGDLSLEERLHRLQDSEGPQQTLPSVVLDNTGSVPGNRNAASLNQSHSTLPPSLPTSTAVRTTPVPSQADNTGNPLSSSDTGFRVPQWTGPTPDGTTTPTAILNRYHSQHGFSCELRDTECYIDGNLFLTCRPEANKKKTKNALSYLTLVKLCAEWHLPPMPAETAYWVQDCIANGLNPGAGPIAHRHGTAEGLAPSAMVKQEHSTSAYPQAAARQALRAPAIHSAQTQGLGMRASEHRWRPTVAQDPLFSQYFENGRCLPVVSSTAPTAVVIPPLEETPLANLCQLLPYLLPMDHAKLKARHPLLLAARASPTATKSYLSSCLYGMKRDNHVIFVEENESKAYLAGQLAQSFTPGSTMNEKGQKLHHFTDKTHPSPEELPKRAKRYGQMRKTSQIASNSKPMPALGHPPSIRFLLYSWPLLGWIRCCTVVPILNGLHFF